MVASTAVVLVVITVVALARLYTLESTGAATEAAGTSTAGPGPVATEDASVDQPTSQSATGVRCEAAGDGPGRFAVAATGPAADPDAAGPVVVALDLVDGDGRRHPVVVPLTAAGTGAWEAVVDGPLDAGSCLVTAVQVGDRVLRTGR